MGGSAGQQGRVTVHARLQRQRAAQVHAAKALAEAGRRRERQPRVALKALQAGRAAQQQRLDQGAGGREPVACSGGRALGVANAPVAAVDDGRSAQQLAKQRLVGRQALIRIHARLSCSRALQDWLKCVQRSPSRGHPLDMSRGHVRFPVPGAGRAPGVATPVG
jgi:hypothetical protein